MLRLQRPPVSRLGYYHFQNQIPPIQLHQRRIVKLDNDIFMPYYSEQEMKEDISALLCIGQETEEDETKRYSNEDWAKAFENPLAVYIGRPVKVPITLNGKGINKSLENLYKLGNKHPFKCGQQGLPHLINGESTLSLKDRGLDEYENGAEILHVTKGISTSMFTLFKKEENFQEEKCSSAFDEYIRHNAQSGTMSNGDWRMTFCNFEKSETKCHSLRQQN